MSEITHMANLQQIMAETSKTYDNSRNALNNQINAIGGELQAQQDRINAQYAQQGKNLDQQRNWAANSASMRAGKTGGSFGGSANIANKRYYQQAYVPAVTQMQTNQANDISRAESDANSRRLSLEQTLAGLNDEANRYAMQRYDAEVARERQEALERERMRQAQRQAEAEAARWRNYMNPQQQPQGSNLKYGFRQGDDGNVWYHNNRTGNDVRFGTYVNQFGGNFNNQAQQMLRSGDAEMQWLANYLNGQQVAYTGGGGKNYYNPGAIRGGTNQRAANIMNRLGIHLVGRM